MNYTENFRLPQWDMQDRVLMEDFNRAMAHLESGLTEIRDASAGRDNAISTSLERSAFLRLCRLSYNHYCAVQNVTPFPVQSGVFFQSFAEGGDKLLRMDGGGWTAGNQLALTHSTFFAALSQNSSPNVYSATFTLPYAGWLGKLVLPYQFNSTILGNRPASIQLRDVTAGTLELDMTVQFYFPNGIGSAIHDCTLNCFLHAKHTYRLEIRLLDTQGVSAEFSIDTAAPSSLELKSVGGGNPSFSHRFQEPEASSGGLFLVRYTHWGAEGGLLLELAGESLTPIRTRTITDCQGREVQEAVFLCKKEVPADCTVTLQVDCGGGSREFCLYDWGGVLFG